MTDPYDTSRPDWRDWPANPGWLLMVAELGGARGVCVWNGKEGRERERHAVRVPYDVEDAERYARACLLAHIV